MTPQQSTKNIFYSKKTKISRCTSENKLCLIEVEIQTLPHKHSLSCILKYSIYMNGHRIPLSFYTNKLKLILRSYAVENMWEFFVPYYCIRNINCWQNDLWSMMCVISKSTVFEESFLLCTGLKRRIPSTVKRRQPNYLRWTNGNITARKQLATISYTPISIHARTKTQIASKTRSIHFRGFFYTRMCCLSCFTPAPKHLNVHKLKDCIILSMSSGRSGE